MHGDSLPVRLRASALGRGSSSHQTLAKAENMRGASGYRAPNTKKVAETVRGSKREAEKVLRGRVGAVETGACIEKTDTKVSEFMEKWLSSYVARITSVRTQQG